MNTLQPLYLHAPIELKAEGDGLPTQFRGVAYSGQVISEYGYRFVVDLASTRTEKTHPLLSQHNSAEPIGLVEQADNDGNKLTVAGTLYSDLGGAAEQIGKRAARGFPYQMSIGLFDIKEDARVQEGKTVTINGRKLMGPLHVLRGGLVRETSVVTLGADRNTNTRFFEALPPNPLAAPTGGNNMPTDDNENTVLQLTKRAETAEAQALAETARADALEAQLKELQAKHRKAELTAMYAQAGKPLTDEAAAPYLEMDAALWDKVRPSVQALLDAAPTKQVENSALFGEQAVGEDSDAGKTQKARAQLSPRDIYAKRAQAVDGHNV